MKKETKTDLEVYRQQQSVVWEMQFWDEVKQEIRNDGVRL